jgi:hypothetical protein
MARDVLIVADRRYALYSDDWSYALFDDYARQVDYLADGIETEWRGWDGWDEQRVMRVVIPTPSIAGDRRRILLDTIRGFTRAVEWADGGTIAFSLDHGSPVRAGSRSRRPVH